MDKISSQVSENLSDAIKQIQEKHNTTSTEDIKELIGVDIKEQLNVGVEIQKKRRKKTKSKSEAKTDNTQTETEDNTLFESLGITEKPEEDEEPRHMKTVEEVCEEDLKKAHDRNYPDPDFDFRNYYEKGQTVYFVHILAGLIQSKELKKLKIRTIYPRMMVCTEDKACCECIGYSQKDNIYEDLKDAQKAYKTIDMAEEEEPKKRKKNNDDEDSDEDKAYYEALENKEEEEGENGEED